MPLIQCDGCGAVFKAGLDAIGKSVGCPKCKTRFVATVKRAGPKQKQSNTRMWIYIAVAAVLLVVVIFAMTTGNSGSKKSPGDAAVAASRGSDTNAPAEESQPTAPPPTKDELQLVVEKLLTAIEQNDAMSLTNVVSFVAYHADLAKSGLLQGDWSALDALGKEQARNAIADSILADEETRSFLQKAQIESFNVLEKDGEFAKVGLILKSMVDKDQQERTLDLRRFGASGAWMLTSMQCSAIGDPVALAAAEHASTMERVRRERSERKFGALEKVEHLADTPEAERVRLDGLAAILVNPETGRRELSKARAELLAAGKPAIPSLLNQIVEHKDLRDPPEGIGVNQVILILRDITQLNFGFSPMAASTPTGSEEREASNQSLRRWFGWWRDRKDNWTGPEPAKEGNEGDGI